MCGFPVESTRQRDEGYVKKSSSEDTVTSIIISQESLKSISGDQVQRALLPSRWRTANLTKLISLNQDLPVVMCQAMHISSGIKTDALSPTKCSQVNII